MQKIIDLSHSSQVRESLRAELMAKYDGKKKSLLAEDELDMVQAAGNVSSTFPFDKEKLR